MYTAIQGTSSCRAHAREVIPQTFATSTLLLNEIQTNLFSNPSVHVTLSVKCPPQTSPHHLPKLPKTLRI